MSPFLNPTPFFESHALLDLDGYRATRRDTLPTAAVFNRVPGDEAVDARARSIHEVGAGVPLHHVAPRGRGSRPHSHPHRFMLVTGTDVHGNSIAGLQVLAPDHHVV